MKWDMICPMCKILNAFRCMLLTPLSNAEEDGLAVATAEFRVKLNRLLAQFRLGELQAQASFLLREVH